MGEHLVSADHDKKLGGLDAGHLSKIWKIDIEAAERTIVFTTQKGQITDNPELSRKYGTNDRMLRYKMIHEYLFMNNFFVPKKSIKSSQGHT